MEDALWDHLPGRRPEMGMVRILALLLIGILVGGPVSGAEVSSIHCGTEVVKIGDSQTDVLEKCGDPSYTVGNAWVYDMGFSQPLKVIHFGGADIFRPVVIRMEEVEQSGSGDEP
jgi:hypothetical protein